MFSLRSGDVSVMTGIAAFLRAALMAQAFNAEPSNGTLTFS